MFSKFKHELRVRLCLSHVGAEAGSLPMPNHASLPTGLLKSPVAWLTPVKTFGYQDLNCEIPSFRLRIRSFVDFS